MATPLQRIQTAWAAGDPLALHREVEQLATEGHSRQTLEDALEALLREIRSAGAGDDTEEIINGVWDRLTGWCHERRIISTPPSKEIKVPDALPANGRIMPEQVSEPSRSA